MKMKIKHNNGNVPANEWLFNVNKTVYVTYENGVTETFRRATILEVE